jgi:uncharacterized protein (DUF1810 family)
VFPQLGGLGRSAMARRYAISGRDEAIAYAAHPVLGTRLRACADALAALPAGLSAVDVLGGVDAQKLRSSMTLFALAVPDEPVFGAVLKRYFGAQHDAATLELLGPRAE